MPLISPTADNGAGGPAGVLYVVATPIGNLEDVTLRALNILKTADLIAAEDTRHSRRLLRHYDIKRPLQAYHEHNEARITPHIVQALQAGRSVALISDAGTPCISDPGYRLVHAAVQAGVAVVPIPGVSAAMTALSASGLPTDGFVFAGFLPKKSGQRQAAIETLATEPRTLIFYESPRRIECLLAELNDLWGDRPAVLARELTKLNEEFLRGTLASLAQALAGRDTIKGECTLLVAGCGDGPHEDRWPAARRALHEGLVIQEQPLAALVRQVADQSGVARNKIYAEALRIKQELE
jgi:16S rRNA (cytidine1402-2'-O)-methyltransferase